MLASFWLFWSQALDLKAAFHSTVTRRNFKKLQYKRFKAIKNLKKVVIFWFNWENSASIWLKITCIPSGLFPYRKRFVTYHRLPGSRMYPLPLPIVWLKAARPAFVDWNRTQPCRRRSWFFPLEFCPIYQSLSRIGPYYSLQMLNL